MVTPRELVRHTASQRVNPNIRLEKIAGLAQQKTELAAHLASARFRLAAVRLIDRSLG